MREMDKEEDMRLTFGEANSAPSVGESMIERVARALWQASEHEGPEGWATWPDTPRAAAIAHEGNSREEWREIARAALRAMREPTEHMNAAGEKPFDEPFVGGRLTPAFAVWEAMIDAALSDDGTAPDKV